MRGKLPAGLVEVQHIFYKITPPYFSTSRRLTLAAARQAIKDQELQRWLAAHYRARLEWRGTVKWDPLGKNEGRLVVYYFAHDRYSKEELHFRAIHVDGFIGGWLSAGEEAG